MAAEDLVAALAVQQPLPPRLLRGLHDAPLGIIRELAERHVLMPGDALEPLPKVLRRRKRDVRRRADRLSHSQRIVAFVEGAILVAGGERMKARPPPLGAGRALR